MNGRKRGKKNDGKEGMRGERREKIRTQKGMGKRKKYEKENGEKGMRD